MTVFKAILSGTLTALLLGAIFLFIWNFKWYIIACVSGLVLLGVLYAELYNKATGGYPRWHAQLMKEDE